MRTVRAAATKSAAEAADLVPAAVGAPLRGAVSSASTKGEGEGGRAPLSPEPCPSRPSRWPSIIKFLN